MGILATVFGLVGAFFVWFAFSGEVQGADANACLIIASVNFLTAVVLVVGLEIKSAVTTKQP